MAAKAAPGPHPGGVCEASVLASKTEHWRLLGWQLMVCAELKETL